jgi:hypothetical protein
MKFEKMQNIFFIDEKTLGYHWSFCKGKANRFRVWWARQLDWHKRPSKRPFKQYMKLISTLLILPLNQACPAQNNVWDAYWVLKAKNLSAGCTVEIKIPFMFPNTFYNTFFVNIGEN